MGAGCGCGDPKEDGGPNANSSNQVVLDVLFDSLKGDCASHVLQAFVDPDVAKALGFGPETLEALKDSKVKGVFENPDVAAALAKLLEGNAAATALGEFFGNDAVVAKLAGLLQNEPAHKHQVTGALIALFGNEGIAGMLPEILATPAVLDKAIKGIETTIDNVPLRNKVSGVLNDQTVQDALEKLLEKEEVAEAIIAFLGNPAVVTALVGILEDENAVKALTTVLTGEVLEFFSGQGATVNSTDLLKQLNGSTAKTCLLSSGKMTGKDICANEKTIAFAASEDFKLISNYADVEDWLKLVKDRVLSDVTVAQICEGAFAP